MILLPGQSTNATVKRDASNNVVYCATGTNNASDKLVYAKGISTNLINAQTQKNWGSYLVSCPAAVDRTFTNKYGSVTFPAVANGWEVGWGGYALLNSGGDDMIGTPFFSTLQNWSNNTDWASAYVMYYFFQTVAYANAYMNYSNLNFTLLAGGGGVLGKVFGIGGDSCHVVGKAAPEPPVKTVTTSGEIPVAPLTTTISTTASSSVTSGGSAWWYDQSRSRNIYMQIAYAPAEGVPGSMITTGDFDLKYDYETGSYWNPNNVSIFGTGAIAFPGFIVRCIYINSPQTNVYSTRTYSGTITHERTNIDGSKFIETAGWNSPSASPTTIALTQTS